MNPYGEAPGCTRTDAILALHLDGDVLPDEIGYAFACGESLHTHLLDCAVCQCALRRARRLDAVLAHGSGRAAADHDGPNDARQELEQRWFRAAMLAAEMLAAEAGESAPSLPSQMLAETVPDRSAGSAASGLEAQDARRQDLWRQDLWRQNGWRQFAVAAGVIAGLTWHLLSTPPAAATVGQVAHGPDSMRIAAAATASAAGAPTEIGMPTETSAVSPTGASPTRLAETGGTGPVFTTDSIRRLKQSRRDAPEQVVVSSSRELQHRFEDRATDPGERMRAAEAMIEVARPSAANAAEACTTLIEMLAGCGDRTAAEHLLHGSLLDRVRGATHVTNELQARLARIEAGTPSLGTGPNSSADLAAARRSALATVLVATRLGTRELDTALRRVVRRQSEFAEVVGAALRSGLRTKESGTLLLDLWQVRVAGGECEDDAAIAELWFHGQPPCVFADVLEALRLSRSAPQRQRCLLALGHAADDAALAPLLQSMTCAQRSEAFVAAFALANLPHAVLAELIPAARPANQWLLRAALTRAGLPAARPWLTALQLRPHEQQLFDRATLASFCDVASWFRDRGGHLGD